MDEEKWPLWISLLVSALGMSVLIRYVPMGFVPFLKEGLTSSGEIQDRKVFAALILTVLAFSSMIVCKVSLRPLEALMPFFTFVALALLFGATASQNYFENYKGQIWFGFGPRIALVTLFSAAIIYGRALTREGSISFQIPKQISVLICVILIVVYLPSVLQFPHGIIDHGHSTYIFNELAGPAVGRYPLGNFTSQYSNLFGYPVVVISIFSKAAAITFMSYWTSALTLVEFFAMAMILRQISRRVPLAFLFVFPAFLILVKQNESETNAGSIAALVSAVPIRTFFPVLVCLVLVRLQENRNACWKFATLGIVSGLAIINNFEFGVTAFLAANITVLLLVLYKQIKWTMWLVNFCSTIALLLSFNFLLFVLGTPFQFSRYIAFSLGFGKSGFGNVSMPFFGTYFLLFSILGVGITTGLYILRELTDPNSHEIRSKLLQRKCVALLLFNGIWGIFSFPYYIGRSVTSGQLQIFLIPSALIIFGLASLHIPVLESEKQTFKIRISTQKKDLPLLFLTILPLVAILQMPNPSFEWARLSGKGEEFSSRTIRDLEVVGSVNLYLNEHPNDQIGFLGNWGNLVSLQTGVSSVIDQNTLNDSTMTPSLSASLCAAIQSAYPRKVLVEHMALPVPSLSHICKNVSFKSKWSSTLDVYAVDNSKILLKE